MNSHESDGFLMMMMVIVVVNNVESYNNNIRIQSHSHMEKIEETNVHANKQASKQFFL